MIMIMIMIIFIFSATATTHAFGAGTETFKFVCALDGSAVVVVFFLRLAEAAVEKQGGGGGGRKKIDPDDTHNATPQAGALLGLSKDSKAPPVGMLITRPRFVHTLTMITTPISDLLSVSFLLYSFRDNIRGSLGSSSSSSSLAIYR